MIFLYFFKPFETYLLAGIPNVHFDNILFWFAALVGIAAYALAHWQSFSKRIFLPVGALDVEALVFETIQAAILVAIIFCAGAILQSVEMLGAHLVARGEIFGPLFGGKLLAIALLLILAVLFFLLHHLARVFRSGGWSARRPPPRSPAGGSS